MGIWQIIYIALLMMGLGIHLAKDGQRREGHYSFGTALFSLAIQIVLLYLGGFFN